MICSKTWKRSTKLIESGQRGYEMKKTEKLKKIFQKTFAF